MTVAHHPERIVHANGIEICYDAFGDASNPPLLLIMGFGAQLTAWPEAMCRLLAARGHWVIRYDNRDTGRSTRFDGAGTPSGLDMLRLLLGRGRDRLPYTLEDMAGDAVGLMDALGIEAAHVVGASMGGMIGQMMAIRHPRRLLTLTSIMSSTGRMGLPLPRPRAAFMLLRPPARSREEYIVRSIELMKALGGGQHQVDEADVTQRALAGYARSPKGEGAGSRQMAAIVASGSRHRALAAVTTPTLVIHGAADPLVPVRHGMATAAAIPGSKLLIIDDMGHSLPSPSIPRIVDAVAAHAAAAHTPRHSDPQSPK